MTKKAINLLRYVFWGFVLDVLLRFVYSSAMQYYPDIAEQFDAWTLCGLGYALPCLFHVKYLAIYGLAKALAQFDGIELPPPPECVTRIHSSTTLWRTFDRGLHLWLTNYIYKPLVGNQWTMFRRSVAAAVCFGCVCLWHGFNLAVVTWCALNFVCIVVEMVGGVIEQRTIKSWSRDNRIRMKCLVAAPWFAIMIISNIFFLSNWELGCVFVQRTLLTMPTALVVTAIMFCGCRTSIRWSEASREKAACTAGL